MITGILMFDVQIEGQKTQGDVDELSAAIVKAVNAVNGVDSCEHVDDDLDGEDEDKTEPETN
jgi:hypothetical protein